MMEKPAPTDHPVEATIRQRWSTRAFIPQPIPATTLAGLFEAARWAASSHNQQPWRFIVGTRDDPASFDPILDCLLPVNKEWAGNASALCIASAKLVNDRDGKPARHAYYDIGAAVTQMTLQAVADGLSVHPMGGFDLQKAREQLSVPDGFDPVIALAIGYPGPVEDLPEDVRKKDMAPRTRLPFSDILFQGQWGRPANF